MSKPNPWIEYDNAAGWCAARGIAGKLGDPLPALMSAEACKLIDDDPEAFQERVRASAYAQAVESRNRRARIERRLSGRNWEAGR